MLFLLGEADPTTLVTGGGIAAAAVASFVWGVKFVAGRIDGWMKRGDQAREKELRLAEEIRFAERGHVNSVLSQAASIADTSQKTAAILSKTMDVAHSTVQEQRELTRELSHAAEKIKSTLAPSSN